MTTARAGGGLFYVAIMIPVLCSAAAAGSDAQFGPSVAVGWASPDAQETRQAIGWSSLSLLGVDVRVVHLWFPSPF